MKVLLRLLVLFSITSVRISSLAESGHFSPSQGRGSTLWSAAVLDATTVVAVGEDGTIARTTDGGDTWTLQSY
jgi:photosystem II stability/assembly factor-like uncharacterized protein